MEHNLLQKIARADRKWIFIALIVFSGWGCTSSSNEKPQPSVSTDVAPQHGLFDSVIAVIKNEFPSLEQSPTITNNSYSSGIHRSAGFVSADGEHASVSIKEFNSRELAKQYKTELINTAYSAKTDAGLKKLNIVIGSTPENSSSVLLIDHLVVSITPGTDLYGANAIIVSNFASEVQENIILLNSGPVNSGN